MVSSVCGAVSGIATVAVYSATKAFENSFGISIGKELEPHGVGVTCLLPGAVRGTEFQKRSNSQEALCWKIPFYTKTAPFVAEWGVRAMLRGDTEVTPGVLNRMFLKVFKPVMPQRLHNLIAEIMWNPLQLPFQRNNVNEVNSEEETTVTPKNETISAADQPPVLNRQRPTIVRPRSLISNSFQPRILILEDPAPEEPEVKVEIEGQGEEASATADDVATNSAPAFDEMASNPEKVVDSIKELLSANPKCVQQPAVEDRSFMQQPSRENLKPLHQPSREHTQRSQQPAERESPTEIDLLLEQYKRNWNFSFDDLMFSPFDEMYFRGN